ncbi:alpha-amylase family glycosyl hydrolase [Aliagarivorans marinus]|uniref:alpha-amylase family glycosyl hydrolase n=1 Tax=Aliagarivorans marinus TaxID=561965 RepID=UPI0003F84B9F|nr:alpha-amylase family glycosyl hydrolase [Aliagarivorans marinus]
MKHSSLVLAMSLTLVACGGGGGGSSDNGGGSGGGGDHQYTPYACTDAVYDKAMELRIYQVMTEAFINGDSNIGHGTGYGTSHHMGDLQGIIDSLDYIQDLGMNAIWLTPVFESVPISGQDHWADRLDATGYFATNFFNIDPNFGDMDTARSLVEQAHARGMYVFFDGVFGHFKTNAQDYPSPSGLTLSTNGVAQGATGREAVYPGDIDFFKEVASYWVEELKIDGWRLDQAYQVPVGAWGEIRKAVEDAAATVTYSMNGETVNPLGYMVAEIWDGGGTQIREEGYGPEEAPGLCSAFDFPMRYRMVQTYAVEESGSGGGNANTLVAGYNTQLANPSHAVPNGFIGNHDLVRFGDLLERGDITQPNEQEYWDRHKAAYAFLSAYSGPITMYYGDEIGDELEGFADRDSSSSCAINGLCDDHVARTSGKIEGLPSGESGAVFTANAQQSDLRDYISELMSVRAANPALYKGEQTIIGHDDSAEVFFAHKQSGNNVVLFISNTSTSTVSIAVTGEEIGSEGQLKDLLTEQTMDIASGGYTIEVAALESLFLEVLSPSADGPQQGGDDGLTGSGPLARCDTPTVSGSGPVGTAVYMRGNYSGGDWGTPASHQLQYKGGNLYQVVIDEPAATAFGFKFADADWDFELSTPSAVVNIAATQDLAKISGNGTEMNIVIPQAGRYVYSMEVDSGLESGSMMVSLCE